MSILVQLFYNIIFTHDTGYVSIAFELIANYTMLPAKHLYDIDNELN